MQIEWQNEKRKISDLKPCPWNPRKWSQSQVDKLKKAIKKYNYKTIVEINTDNMVCAGHMRIEALKQLGRENEEIEVRVPNRELTRKEFDENLIGSNKLGGEFDFGELADFDKDLLMDSGFDEIEIETSKFSFGEDQEKEASNNKLEKYVILKIECPPRTWILNKDKIVDEIQHIINNYGMTMTYE